MAERGRERVKEGKSSIRMNRRRKNEVKKEG
jgi:hypothetical protein